MQGGPEWIGFVILGVIVVVPLATRRFRLFGYVLLADVLAIAAMALVLWPLNGREARAIVHELTTEDGITTSLTSGEVGIVVWAASFVVLAPFVPRRIRRAGAVGLAVVVLLRLVVHATLIGNVLLAIPVGALAGTVVLLARTSGTSAERQRGAPGARDERLAGHRHRLRGAAPPRLVELGRRAG